MGILWPLGLCLAFWFESFLIALDVGFLVFQSRNFGLGDGVSSYFYKFSLTFSAPKTAWSQCSQNAKLHVQAQCWSLEEEKMCDFYSLISKTDTTEEDKVQNSVWVINETNCLPNKVISILWNEQSTHIGLVLDLTPSWILLLLNWTLVCS